MICCWLVLYIVQVCVDIPTARLTGGPKEKCVNESVDRNSEYDAFIFLALGILTSGSCLHLLYQMYSYEDLMTDPEDRGRRSCLFKHKQEIFKEERRVLFVILFLFTFSYLTRFAYDWYLVGKIVVEPGSEGKKTNEEFEQNLFRIQVSYTILSFVWDFIPILAMLLIHIKHFQIITEQEESFH